MLRRIKITLVALTISVVGSFAQTALEIPTFEQRTLSGAQKQGASATNAAPKALTAAVAFADAPLSIFPTIDRTTRLDMIDYFNSGSDKPSKNAFKGNARILGMNDTQITFSTSDIQEVELSLIPHKSDTLIMVITTIKTPIEDSDVKFYTTKWTLADEGLFLVPQLDDWITDDGKKRKSDLENLYPITLARCVYKPETGILTIENKIGDLFPETESQWAKDYLRTHLVYHWTGKKMEKMK